jgi:hypothetical protein
VYVEIRTSTSSDHGDVIGQQVTGQTGAEHQVVTPNGAGVEGIEEAGKEVVLIDLKSR